MSETIEGLVELDKKFQKLTKMTATKGITNACLQIERDAKILVPVDTGQLRLSITHFVEGNEGIVGTSREYAAKVEFGTDKQRAQPYLGPAFDMNRENTKQYIQNDLLEQMEAIAK